ncbi:uncharacterized protein [Typha angustifolia]|uniref:uncharacterized protein n=1 Tax=Typha angustifolia TaxID=59011 RepID=UPI003C309AF4
MASRRSRLPPMSMDRALIVAKPTGVMNSIFVSTAGTASKMLMAIASSASEAAVGEGERWRPIDHVRHLLMLTIWANVWVLRVLVDVFPSPRSVFSSIDFSVDGLVGTQCSSSSSSSSELVVHHGGVGSRGMSGSDPSATAIGRSLTHILGILNEIPATSRKYEYVLAMADRLVNDNLQAGHASLLDVTRTALSSAFSRTCDLLRRSLRSPHSSVSSSSSSFSFSAWQSRVLHLLPPGPRRLYEGIRLCLNGLLPPTDAWLEGYKPDRHAAVAGPGVGPHDWLEAEKLAHELLWIANKLRACGATCEAIVRWAFASGLAPLALTAHPRVQGPIVKITVMLIRELGRGEWEAAREVRFGILALWLPVLCYASNGVTCPVVVGPERWETERAAEDLIAGLPVEDQEIILRNWVEDFAASESDWPNLQRSFDRWSRHSRKQLLAIMS